MLKRLLVAVFVLGLFLTFANTAFSTDQLGRQPKSALHPKPELNLNPGASRGGGVYPWNQKLAPGAHRAFPAPLTVSDNATSWAPDTLSNPCPQFVDYVHIPGLYNAYGIAGTDGDRLAMSYDVQAGHSVTISGAAVRIYSKIGTPSLTISVHSDNLGNPGPVLYTETLTSAFFGVGNFYYPFTAPQTLASPGVYWLSVGCTGVVTDTVAFGFNRGPANEVTGRGRYQYLGTWYLPTGLGFTYDYDMRIAARECQFYSQCYRTVIDPRGMYGVWMPDNGYLDGSTGIGIGQRFVAAGPETLKSVRALVVDETAFGFPGQSFYGPTSTNGYVLKLWADSSGSVDNSIGGTVIGSVPAGLANVYPTTNNNGSAAPLRRDTITFNVPSMPVVLGPYHLTVEPTTSNMADGAAIFRYGIDNTYGGASCLFTAPGNTSWGLTGNDQNFHDWNTGAAVAYDGSFDIRPDLCKDEFSVCQNQKTYDAPQMWDYGMASGSNIVEWAHLVKGNPVNRVEKLRFQVDGVGTVGLTAKIWSKTLSGPGVLLYSQLVTTPTFNPGWTEVVIPGGVQILGDFYIGYEGSFPNPGDILYGETEDFFLTSKNGGAWLNYVPAGGWIPITDFGYFDNLMAEAEFCSIPVNERICVTENDWPTFQHDYARTGASGISLEDAFCDLTTDWSHIRPTGRGTNLNGPIIWNNYVICAFSAATIGSYVVFNLQTGAIVDEIDDATWFNDQSIIGGNIRCTPTVATIGGNPVLLLTAGNPGSVSAFDLTGGFPLAFPGALLWNFNDLGNMGSARYGNLIVISDVVYVADDNNKVYAIDGTTGLSFAGWASPYTLTYNSQKSGSTNGTNLFYSLFNTAGNGKITAIKASNGTLAWDFTALLGTTYFTGVTAETFEGGVSYDGGAVFSNSRVLDGTANSVPNFRRGVLYQLNATTGAVITSAPGERARTTTPTLDLNTVIVGCLPPFGGGTSATGGNLTAFSRTDGQLIYSSSSFLSTQAAGQIGYIVEGLLTCEPAVSDLFYGFNLQGYLSCFNADDGDEIYHRRVDHGAGNNQGGMGALGKDATGAAHLVFTDAFGGIYSMKKGVDRPRLELLAGTAAVAVPFGSPADTVVEFPNMYTNTGCGNLVVSLTASTTSNGTTAPAPGYRSIGSRLSESTDQLADALAGKAIMGFNSDGKKVLAIDRFNGSLDETFTFADAREVGNRSAAAIPAFINQNGGSYAGDVFDPAMGGIVTGPGDTSGIRVHANGPLVNRGPNAFYVEFTVINDPDYYIDNTARRPEVFLTLVGGCLVDTTTLHFGAAGVNHQHVYNTLKQARNGTDGFLIDGVDNEIMYQGFVAYGVSEHRQALNSDKWDGTNNEWISIQADPNYCDNNCTPAIQAAVAMGAISADGITYTPISGSTVCKSFIDSVQNHDLGGGWDWDNHAAPFDNDSTMGLGGNAKTFGVLSAPNVGDGLLLNYMTLTRISFKERNGNAVPGWKLWSYMDHDLAARDTAYYDGAHSVGWGTGAPGTGAGETHVSGFAKVPFGCGYSPLKSVTSCAQNTISFVPDWDTAWKYISLPTGQHTNDYTGATDYGSLYCFDEYDFPAGGTHDVGIVYFGFNAEVPNTNSSGRIAKLATIVNQFAGFGRGDVNNDGVINLADIVYLANNVNYGGPGAIPFVHMGDVDASGGAPNQADVTYLVNYYFSCGPCPVGAWVLSL